MFAGRAVTKQTQSSFFSFLQKLGVAIFIKIVKIIINNIFFNYVIPDISRTECSSGFTLFMTNGFP